MQDMTSPDIDMELYGGIRVLDCTGHHDHVQDRQDVMTMHVEDTGLHSKPPCSPLKENVRQPPHNTITNHNTSMLQSLLLSHICHETEDAE